MAIGEFIIFNDVLSDADRNKIEGYLALKWNLDSLLPSDHSYKSDDNHLFTLDANGTLKTASIFDYESNASSYSIRVQVKDELNASTVQNFTVTLLDVYENLAPLFQSDGNLSTSENETFVYQFNATDPNGDTLSYSITLRATTLISLN